MPESESWLLRALLEVVAPHLDICFIAEGRDSCDFQSYTLIFLAWGVNMADALSESMPDDQITVMGFTQIISDGFDLSVYNYVSVFSLCFPIVLFNVFLGWPDYRSLFLALGEFSSNPAHLRMVLNESDRLSWLGTVTGIWTFLASCGIAQLFHDRFNKRSVPAAQSIVSGMKRAPLAFLVAVIASVAIVVAVLALSLVQGLLGQVLGPAASILVLVTAIVVILMYLQYAIAFAACVLDKDGPIGAYRSARDLTRGFRWSLFGLFLFAGLFFFLLQLVLMAIAGALIMVLPNGLTAVGLVFVLLLLNPLVMGWSNGLMVASYNRLKALQGTDV